MGDSPVDHELLKFLCTKLGSVVGCELLGYPMSDEIRFQLVNNLP